MDETALSAAQRDTRAKYARMARRYDLAEGPSEWLGVGRMRRRHFARASGEVLDVATGTGKNLPCFPPGCAVSAVDLSPEMLAVARRRAERRGLEVAFAEMPAERLDFPDGRFDTVASALSLCTFADPLAALREMARVCKPDGRILLMEHGRSSVGWLGRFQDRRAEAHAKVLNCRWNLEPAELAAEAGLKVEQARRVFLGVFHLLDLRP